MNPDRPSEAGAVVERVDQGRFKPGRSANPGGRPKGLARRVRELTSDGEEIVDVMLRILRGEVKGTARDRLEAGRWLADRGFGRSPETLINVSASDTPDSLADLADDVLERVARGLASGTPKAES